MKRLVCLLLVLAVCAGFAMPVLAADTFVPSVTYKPTPDVEDATMGGEEVKDCIIVTSITQAEEKSTDISQEERDTLLMVYKEISNGNMLESIGSDYVVRELVDVSFKHEECIQSPGDHGNKNEELHHPDVSVEVTFELGVGPATDVVVMVYANYQWAPVEKVQNNGNGSVTVEFDDIGPVAFVVKQDSLTPPAQTGDTAGRYLPLWTLLLVLSAAALVAVVIRGSRKKVW